MAEEMISVRAVDGEVEQSLNVDELIIALPDGIKFSLFPGDEGENEVVDLIRASEPLIP